MRDENVKHSVLYLEYEYIQKSSSYHLAVVSRTDLMKYDVDPAVMCFRCSVVIYRACVDVLIRIWLLYVSSEG